MGFEPIQEVEMFKVKMPKPGRYRLYVNGEPTGIFIDVEENEQVYWKLLE